MSENYNLQPDTNSQIIKNAESYDLDTREHMDNGVSVQMCPNGSLQNLARHSKASQVFSDGFSDGDGISEQDTREKLEADVCEFFEGIRYGFETAVKWLDRQAKITERELCVDCDWPLIAVQPDEEAYDRIAALEAERDITKEQHRQRVITIERLTAECNELKEQLQRANKSLSTIGIIRLNEQLDKLTAERDELQAAIDEMENGQFYAMYKAKREECEQLKKVARTQAESFKKLECELAGKDG